MPTSKQRRAADRRRRRRQLGRQHERQIRRRRINLILSVVGIVVIIGVVVGIIVATNGSGGGLNAVATPSQTASAATTPAPSASTDPASTTATAPTSDSTSKSGAGGGTVSTAACSYPTSGTAARKVNKPPTTASKLGTATVALTTSQGSLTFTLNRAAAPCTVNSFISLAKQKYFDKTSCHRLVTKGIFVLQCGDPTGTGSGGPGYKFDDELSGTETYTRGVLAMANAGANTNGSQFFIVDRKSTLGPSYTIFGKVSSGLGVIDKVAAAGTKNGSTDGAPKLPVTLQTVTVSG